MKGHDDGLAGGGCRATDHGRAAGSFSQKSVAGILRNRGRDELPSISGIIGGAMKKGHHRRAGLEFLAASVFAAQVSLGAQQRPPLPAPYVSGGVTLSPDTPVTRGLALGVGVPMTPTVTLEFSGEWRTGIPLTWGLSSLGLTSSTFETIRRDRPFMIAIRYSPSADRVKTDLIVGGGFNARTEDDFLIAVCSGVTGVCTSRPRSDAGGESWLEPGVVIGADIRIPVGARFDVGPSFRLFAIHRLACNTKGRACVSRPATPDGLRVEIGFRTAWHWR